MVLALAATPLATSCSGNGEETSTTAPVTTEEPSTTAVQGPPPEAVETGWSDLANSDCFDTIDDPIVDDLAVWKLPCESPHAYEVYDVIDAAAASQDDEYPGVERMQNWAEEACFSRFEAFVGVRWTISELDIATWWPSEDSWNQGDRTVLCTVMDHTRQPLEGTQRGSER